MKKPAKYSRAKFILCDDVRADASGKISFVGVYAGEKILVFANKNDALLKDLKAVAVFGPLTLVVTLFGKRSKQPARFELVMPGGKATAGRSLGLVNAPADGSVTLVAKLDRVVVPRWGKFAARFVVGKETLAFPFEITAAPAISRPPGGVKP